MDDTRFTNRQNEEVAAVDMARRILGVDRNASPQEIKNAWRRACLKCHPDRNRDDDGAERKLIVLNCAYRVLTGAASYRDLLDLEPTPPTHKDHEPYDRSNAWGHFLWWRERFFG